jgi:PAS domain S-box-containing protein
MKLRTILLILALLSLFSVSAGGYIYYVSMKKSSLERDHQEGMIRTQLIADHIDSFLSERQKTVKAFAGLKELHQALADKDESKILEANMILEHFQQALNVDVCYLMDEQGNTVASSNRNAPDSFVGKNYAFRPYFQEAKQGHPAIYMALGATSGKRGIYFSHPVYGELNEPPSGVVVVKDSNQTTEQELSREYEGVMLFTDPHGVIFVSSREDWLFHVLWRVSPDEITKIAKTRQFGDGPLNWTGLERENETHAIDKSGIEYDIHQTEIKNSPGWKVIYLHYSRAVMNRISGPLFKTVGLLIFISCLIVGLAVLFLYREAANVIVLRKKAEEALQKEKGFSDSLVNSLPGVFYLFDEKELRFHRWNHNFENVTGYSSSEIAGMSPLELFDEHEGARVAERIRQVFEKGYATVKAAFLTKKGDRIPYFFTGHALKIEEETYLIGMGIDITERKQADDTLRESEEKYRNILESIEDGYFEVDNAGNFTFFNDSLCKIYGYSKDELMGMNNRQYTDEENAKKLYKTFNKVYTTGKSDKGFDWEIIRKDGGRRHVEASVSLRKDFEGQPTGFRGIVRDVTERKRVEKILENEKEKFRVLVEESPLGVALISKDGRYKYLNPRFTEMFGYTLEDIPTGREWFKKAYPDQQYRHEVISVWINDQKEFGVGESRPRTYNVTSKDGSEKIIDFRPVTMETGDQFVICEDITDRTHAENERERIINELQSALTEVKTLSGLLPICAHCKKIRDDKGYWNQIESYIHKHSEAEFSHGICPECAKKYYPDMHLYEDTDSGQVC